MMGRSRLLRHHVPPSWELYEYRDGRWVPVSSGKPRMRKDASSPILKRKTRLQRWVMVRAAHLLAEMIRGRKGGVGRC
ncbi:MAG: hypothetical protein QW424_04745 [Candidatus Bathyarchaeia archaeon]